MLYWIIILGAFVFAGFFAPIEYFATGDLETVTGVIMLEVLFFIPLFVLCLVRYLSPAYKAKQKQRAKAQATTAERERLRKIEEERKRKDTTIVATRLIGEGSAEFKKSVGSMVTRGVIGGFFAGTAGAAIGAATAKNKNTNKKVRRFLVKYSDGHIEEKEAKVGSALYKEYMKYLEWEK